MCMNCFNIVLFFHRDASIFAARHHHPIAELGILKKKKNMRKDIQVAKITAGLTLKLKLRWSTASQWWISVFTISPLSTSQTRTVLSEDPEMITCDKNNKERSE